jgi:uncharacterized protein HemX
VRPVFRTALTLALVAALAPAAYAAGPTATTAVPTNSSPQPAPGSPFSAPVQDLVGQATTETTVTNTKRAGEVDNGRGTLLFLSLASLVLIFAVGGYIWYEGRQTRAAAKSRRRRMRSGRTPQPAAAGSGARRGPPPPPRKRRSAAKRKKR